MARPYNNATSRRKLNMVGSKSFAVSLPLEVVRSLGWQKGDKLLVRRLGQVIVIEKEPKRS